MMIFLLILVIALPILCMWGFGDKVVKVCKDKSFAKMLYKNNITINFPVDGLHDLMPKTIESILKKNTVNTDRKVNDFIAEYKKVYRILCLYIIGALIMPLLFWSIAVWFIINNHSNLLRNIFF